MARPCVLGRAVVSQLAKRKWFTGFAFAFAFFPWQSRVQPWVIGTGVWASTSAAPGALKMEAKPSKICVLYLAFFFLHGLLLLRVRDPFSQAPAVLCVGARQKNEWFVFICHPMSRCFPRSSVGGCGSGVMSTEVSFAVSHQPRFPEPAPEAFELRMVGRMFEY